MQSVPTNVWEWLDKIGPDDRMPIIIVSILFGLAAIVFVVWIISHTIGTIHRIRVETALKQELLERGLSAEEIATVVTASAKGRGQVVPSNQRG
jgi:hypothetical protein